MPSLNKGLSDIFLKVGFLETEYGNYHFVDFHKGGDNGFADSEYGDFDHLNHRGSRRFSGMIAERLERICAEPLPQVRLGTSKQQVIPQVNTRA